MQPYQERVVNEQADLQDKLDKLDIFIRGDRFSSIPMDEQLRMEQQKHFMHGYNEVLKQRIEAF